MRHAAPLNRIEFAGLRGWGRRLPPIIAAAMAAVLVLAGSLIVATERADAQSSTTLVSNLDKHRPGSQIAGTASSFAFNDEVAAAFTTGTNDYGYGLASVTVELESSTVHAGTPVPEFTIRSNRNGSPGPVLFTLDNPSNIGSINFTPSRFTFNAPPRTELAPNTTYWLVAYATDAVLLNGYTEILDEDAGKKPGWSIGDAVFSRDRDSNSAWDSSVTRTLKMGLRGVVFGPDVGQLALYWLDSSGQQDHPEAKGGNLLQLQYCRDTLPFMVYFHGDFDHRDIDEWDVDIRPWRGVVGDVTYGFREQTDATDGFHQMYGRVTFDGPTLMTIKIRARDGNTWGPWSPPSGLYCREVPRVASITTSRGQIINEGDSFTFDVVFDKAMQLDTDLNVRLTRSEGSYPKFRGWLCEVTVGSCERTITVRRGQSAISLEMRSIDDDIWGNDPEITLEIVPGTGYSAGHQNAVSFQILDGSYGPELDTDDIPTGNIVFNSKADTVTRSFPRCGESSKSTATNRVGLMEVREDAGTIQVPVHTIAGGTDFVHTYILRNFEGTATRENDYNAPLGATFQPLAKTTLIDVEIVNHPRVEDANSFRLFIWRNELTEAQHLFDCQEVEIIIEDNDTADTTIRIADGANAAFTDFVGREARVTEGNTIKLQVSPLAETGDCIVPFRINAWITASGDVSVVDQSGFTTNNGTRSGLSIPPCTDADEMEVPTFATAGDQGTKTVYFDIAPDDDERIFLEGGRETVRYTVHIDDSEASSQQVEADETPPQLQSATVDGSSLTLAYDETLDSVAVPNSAFTVNVDGSPRPVLVAAVVQSNVLLHLSAPVEAGEVVTVDYTIPTDEEAARVQDTSGNAAGSLSGQAVTNNTTSSGNSRSDEQDPPGVPQGLDVALQQSGKLKATWTAPKSGPAPEGYTIQWKVSGDDWAGQDAVSQANVRGLSHVITGLTDGTEYAVRVIANRDDANSGPSGEVTATPAETTPPELSSPSVDGATLTLTYDEPLDTGDAPDRSAFTVTVAGSGRGVDTVAVSGSVVTLTLVTAVFAGDAVTVAYAAPTGDSASRLQDLAGNAAASFSGQDVTNDTQAADPMTATTHDVPSAHDGRTIFTFELRFSEAPRKGFSYKTLRDNAFTVTGGEVVKARRLEKGKNVRWEISVRPDGSGAVTIVLPATTDCAATGAVCTQDRRPLSNRLAVTVPGP